MREFIYGFAHYLLDVICAYPSQNIRRWLLTGIFGLEMGPRSRIYRRCRLRAPWKIRIGPGSVVGCGVELDGRGHIDIGENVNISSDAMLWTMQHDHRAPNFAANPAKVTLEKYVWLGPRVIVLPGVTVREGCVVGAGAVVTKTTEPYGIYAGIPASRVGERARDLDYVPGRSYTPFV